METPTADQVRERSPLLKQRYPDNGPDEAIFEAVIEDSAVVVASLTGRLIEPYEAGEEVPAGLVNVAIRAIARMSELMDTEETVEFADVSARGRRLRSFTAGPYSESYFAPGELIVKNGRPQMSPDSLLDRLLWALATEDAQDEWIALATGVQRPAGAVTEFDFRRMGARRGVIPQTLGGGPDGW